MDKIDTKDNQTGLLTSVPLWEIITELELNLHHMSPDKRAKYIAKYPNIQNVNKKQ